MNIIQLRSLCEIVDNGLKMSSAAETMYRAQTSISRQVRDLETELGIEIFVRSRNKVLGITEEGEAILKIARRIVGDAQSIKRACEDFRDADRGDFVIATTHTQARYVLPDIVEAYVRQYPRVRLSLRQGTPSQCVELVAAGQAHIAVCAAETVPDDLVRIICRKLDRVLLTPALHPLLNEKKLRLKTLAEYPLITYEQGYSSRSIVEQTFAKQRLTPHIVLGAMDADVCKAYVARGLGLAILAAVTYEPAVDHRLRHIDVSHLFPPSYLSVVVRRHSYLSTYMMNFVARLAPHMNVDQIDLAINGKPESASA